MTTFEIIIIAIGLAMDASAVSFTAAAAGYAKDARAVLRLSFHFGLFHFLGNDHGYTQCGHQY